MYKLGRIIYFVFLLNLLPLSKSANILGIFPLGVKSHFFVSESIMKSLAKAGHHVTVVSPYPQQKPFERYEDVDVSQQVILRSGNVNLSNFADVNAQFTRISSLRQYAEDEHVFCNSLWENPQYRRLMKRKFDAVFVEILGIHCFLPLGRKFQCPVLGIVASRISPVADAMIGNPNNPSFVPRLTGYVSHVMNFGQRFVNVYDYLVWMLWQRFVNDAATKRYVGGAELPQVSLIFYNNHFSIHRRPTVPNAVDIGGIHVQPAKPIPEDMENFINKSIHGVVFVSFGSMVNIETIPKDMAATFLGAFASIPQRVLWRYKNVHNHTIPSNVYLKDWFPQRDILEHKNVVAFIGHGGLMSTYEAVHTATPMIGIPFRYDQGSNIALLEELGAVIHLDYTAITKQKLLESLKAIIYNNRYKNRMRELSRTFHDRPLKPSESVVYWTEYVLRHNGTKHMRSQQADMPFYKYLFLDMVASVLAFLIATVYIVHRLLHFLRKKPSKPKHRNNKTYEVNNNNSKKVL